MKIEWILAVGIVIAAGLPACDKAPERGDCDPGYLEVDGSCELAVGMSCEGGCLSRICVQDDEGDEFCTVGCDKHEDCPVAFFCDATRDSRCYPGQRPPPCQSDEDCQACTRCQDGECRLLDGCQLCLVDQDCGSCRRCQDGECIPIQACTPCVDERDCGSCELCDPLQRICIDEPACLRCSGDLDCPVCTRCEAGECVDDLYEPGVNDRGCFAPCFNDADCPERTACLFDQVEVANICLPLGLEFGEDCSRGSDAQCASSVCVASDGDAQCSILCQQESDCPVGTDCRVGEDCRLACRPLRSDPPGELCRHDAQCPADRVCTLEAFEGAWRGRCERPEPCALEAGAACDAVAGDRCPNGLCSPLGSCAPLCLSDSDCPSLHVCSLQPIPLPGAEAAAPAAICAPVSGAVAGLGEPCPAGDAACISGDCMPGSSSAGSPSCVADCDPGAGQCPDAFACLTRRDGIEGTACQPAPLGGDCQGDGDCIDTELCSLNVGSFELRCGGGVGPGLVGEACAQASDCASGICASPGRCAASCAEDEDCPDGQACEQALALLDSAEILRLWACTDSEASRSPCRTDGDCSPPEICGPEPDLWTGGLGGSCSPVLGVGEVGQACLWPVDCASAWCSASGFCASPCASDSDCPAFFACGPAEVAGPLSAEVRLCLRSDGELGHACPDGDINCASGPCLQAEDAPAYCSLSCEVDEDCAAAEGMICIGQGQGGALCGWVL